MSDRSSTWSCMLWWRKVSQMIVNCRKMSAMSCCSPNTVVSIEVSLGMKEEMK